MALWTLFGLASGKATTPWPADGGSDGQDGLLGMPRYNPAACQEGCDECATVCPTQAIEARDDGLFVDYGRCVVCQLCTEACPTGAMEPSNDWAFGVRDRADLVWSNETARPVGCNAVGPKRVSPQPAHSSCRRRLLQRLRVRTASPQQPFLQSPSLRNLLHPVAALRRSASRHGTGDTCDVRAPHDGLRSHARTALGDGGRNMRRFRWNTRRQLCLRDWPRGRSARGSLPPRMSAEPGRHHRSPSDVSRSRSPTSKRGTCRWLISSSSCRPCFGRLPRSSHCVDGRFSAGRSWSPER